MAYAPSETVYRIKANSRIAVPMDEAYSFLGEAGSTVWVGPQAEEDGKIYLAMAADNFPAGVVESDRIEVRLVSFEGPGEFALYETDSFGLPVLNYSTADGLDESDLRVVTATEHSHLNWAFTAPGTYTIGLEATAVRASDGEPLSSEITTFSFEVVPPVIIDEGDADIATLLEGDRIILESFWGLTEMAYAPSETVYRIKANSRIAVPMDEAYSFLGEAGSTVWVGPQSEEDGKIYLAMAADNFPAGVVESDRIEVRLVSFEGPGEFALYETDSFGLPVLNYSTADGLDESDLRVVTATEHSHLNWAFTAPGIYTIGLEATAVRASDGEPLSSDITTFSFEVVPPIRTRLTLDGPAAVVLVWEGIANTRYIIQGTTDIADGEWQSLSKPIPGVNGTMTRTVDITNQTTGFLRVVEILE
jgi:surface-anchored protein